MEEINQKELDTAIALGDAICTELGICCERRGQVIFQVYKKLGELRSQKETTEDPETGEAAQTE